MGRQWKCEELWQEVYSCKTAETQGHVLQKHVDYSEVLSQGACCLFEIRLCVSHAE